MNAASLHIVLVCFEHELTKATGPARLILLARYRLALAYYGRCYF